ncbi:hypothetical protein AAMO2058_000917700 [Amorphochlora amoebiformis]
MVDTQHDRERSLWKSKLTAIEERLSEAKIAHVKAVKQLRASVKLELRAKFEKKLKTQRQSLVQRHTEELKSVSESSRAKELQLTEKSNELKAVTQDLKKQVSVLKAEAESQATDILEREADKRGKLERELTVKHEEQMMGLHEKVLDTIARISYPQVNFDACYMTTTVEHREETRRCS